MIGKMVKGTILAVVLVLAGLWISRGAIGSYVRMAWSEARQQAENMVPLEWELKRARHMIERLDPEIERMVERVIHEEIEVARLRRQLEENEKRLAKSQREILRLRDDLADGSAYYVYSGRQYSRERVRSDLAARFARHRDLEAVTEKLRKILDIRQNKLRAVEQQVESLRSAKQRLEVEVEHLEARLELVRAAELPEGLTFDDSHLNRTRDLLDQIETRLDVTERMMHSRAEPAGSIHLDDESPSSEDVVDEVTRYFERGDSSEEQAPEVATR